MATVRGTATTALIVAVVVGGGAGARAATDSTRAQRAGGPAAAGIAAADPLPFFKPDREPVVYGPPLPDPDVPQCAARDRECLEAHDAAALSAALAEGNDARCDDSRRPDACRAAFEMITGNVGMKADAILDDPCSWVLLVDRGVATIESKRLGATRRYADRGWKPRTFLGKCDLSRLSSLGSETAVPLPSWVPPPSAPLQSSGLTTTMTAPRTKMDSRAASAAAGKSAPDPRAAAPVASKNP